MFLSLFHRAGSSLVFFVNNWILKLIFQKISFFNFLTFALRPGLSGLYLALALDFDNLSNHGAT